MVGLFTVPLVPIISVPACQPLLNVFVCMLWFRITKPLVYLHVLTALSIVANHRLLR